jgi:hypothetical protein
MPAKLATHPTSFNHVCVLTLQQIRPYLKDYKICMSRPMRKLPARFICRSGHRGEVERDIYQRQ